MRITEIITEQATLLTDNPGGEWLENEVEDVQAAGTNNFGAPKRFGAITAWFSERVMLPVDIAAKVKGVRGEQRNVRNDNLAWLIDYMKTNNHLPLGASGREYAPLITVDYSGTPWVNEGNHRIMAAKALGWKYIPVDIKYFAGGEKQDSILSPERVKKWDSEGKQ
jgi:hypothetical protein